MSDETYYALLGISETATQADIDRAYQNFVEAYHVLSDATGRSSYDEQLSERRRQNASAPVARSKDATSCPLYPDVFSQRVGCSIAEAKDFLAGKLPITPALARKLQSEFGSSLEFWMSQPFEQHSANPFMMMATALIFMGLGYIVLVVFAHVF